jgi:hypothetical protein
MTTVPEDMAAFFRSHTRTDLQREVLISKRFINAAGEPEKFLLRAVSEAENQSLKRSACREQDGRVYLDKERYEANLIVASCLRPNFKNAQLQAEWSVVGAVDLLQKMLLAGEYERLLACVRELSGFDVRPEELKDQVKN